MSVDIVLQMLFVWMSECLDYRWLLWCVWDLRKRFCKFRGDMNNGDSWKIWTAFCLCPEFRWFPKIGIPSQRGQTKKKSSFSQVVTLQIYMLTESLFTQKPSWTNIEVVACIRSSRRYDAVLCCKNNNNNLKATYTVFDTIIAAPLLLKSIYYLLGENKCLRL